MVSLALPLQAQSPPPPATAMAPCMVSTVDLCLPLQSRVCLHIPSLLYRVRSHRGRIHEALLQHQKDIEPKTEKSFSRWTLLHALHCLLSPRCFFSLHFFSHLFVSHLLFSSRNLYFFYSCPIRHNNREWRVLDRGKAGRAIWRLVALTHKGAPVISLVWFSRNTSIVARYPGAAGLPSYLVLRAKCIHRNYRKICLITVALSTWPRVMPFSLCLLSHRLSRFSVPSGSGRLFTSAMSTVDGLISMQRVHG